MSVVALCRAGSVQIVTNAVRTVDPGGPGHGTRSVTDAPGDVLVMSPECRGVDKGTSDTIRMWGVNSRSAMKVGVLAVDLCSPGPLCKLDCPWLNPYLFVSLGEWFVTGREQPVLADSRRYSWKPEGTHSTVGFPQECAQVVSRDFAPKVDPDVINRSSDLVNPV